MALELDVTVGIIGGGSMGGAIARGLVESATLPADRVLVADPDPARRDGFSALGIRAVEDGASLVGEGAEAVILAVKPQIIGGVMGDVHDLLARLLGPAPALRPQARLL